MSTLALPTSLWTLMDQYLVALTNSWKIQYTEVASAGVILVEQFDPGSVDYPFILIAGYERKMQEAEAKFGDGIYHLDGMTYEYEIHILAAFDELYLAKNFAANAGASYIDALRQVPTFGGLSAANGEYVKYFDWDDGDLYVRGLAAEEPHGKYTGEACVRINVMTEI